MRNSKWLCALLLLVGVSINGVALANHGHGGVGVRLYWGMPYPYPYSYYPAPYYYYPYYPSIIEVPTEPPVYIERGDMRPAPAAPEAYYWYHCAKPRGYYPYIKECPGGWQRVVPTPPPQY